MSERTPLSEIIDRLYREGDATDGELLSLIKSSECDGELRAAAEKRRKEIYGTDVYIRGLIEISSFCRNNCYYCGIRAANGCAERYRLTTDEILSCCQLGYELGFRTFVLQGGEDPVQDEDFVTEAVKKIRAMFPDCAITLSLGEWGYDSYKRFFDAGADRYLLRHETASKEHYERLHPKGMSFERRMRCLSDLRDIGYQVGCGFMVGSPWQTEDDLVRDLRFIKDFSPEMIGIGPFLPHSDTPFGEHGAGSVDLTLRLLSILRLMNPYALLPATTALGTARADGRGLGILSGANVIMPNLSPKEAREKYMLYNNKLNTGAESAEGLDALRENMQTIGYNIVVDRGDCKGYTRKEKKND